MVGPIWVAWLVFVLLCLFSIVLLSGKGGFLVAGFNTLPKEEKEKYNQKRLSRIMGVGFSIVTIIIGISIYYKFELPSSISWFFPWGILLTTDLHFN